MSKRKYFVQVPIAGVVSAEVFAEDEASAIGRILDSQLSVSAEWEYGDIDEEKDEWVELESLEMMESTGEGNMNYLQLSRAYAEEQEEISDE